jgi:hypothetical protein
VSVGGHGRQVEAGQHEGRQQGGLQKLVHAVVSRPIKGISLALRRAGGVCIKAWC